MKGILVALEGVDGSGKSTQIPLLAQRLSSVGIKTSVYSYPTHDQFFGKIIREQFLTRKVELSPLDEACLFLLDMAADKQKIKRDVEAGKVVFLDRYFFSTVAYQSARGFGYGKIKMIVDEVMELPKPKLVLYFDIAARAAALRKAKQKRLAVDRNEGDIAFQELIRTFYQRLLKESYRADRWVKIDARKSIKDVNDTVFEEVSSALHAPVSK